VDRQQDRPDRWADDYEYFRRASLDINRPYRHAGEIAVYMKDPVATRRSLLIERLLSSDEYPKHWADSWSNWLLTRSGIFGSGRYQRRDEEVAGRRVRSEQAVQRNRLQAHHRQRQER